MNALGILLSRGLHPTSHRARASHADLAALRIALDTGLPVIGLHVGAFDESLRDYGAYGLRELRLLESLDQLAPCVAQAGIGLLLAGSLGEAPGADGLFPYRAAQALGWPLRPELVQLQQADGGWHALSRLGTTLRRRHALTAPAVLLAAPVDTGAMAYAAQQRARLVVHGSEGHAAPVSRAARGPEAGTPMPQPAWTRPDPEANAATRLATLRGLRTDAGGRIVTAPTADEAVRHLLGFLRRHGLKVSNDPTKDEDSDHTN